MGKRCRSRQKIKAIILAGSRDFGRCPITSHLPAALWPVGGKSALEQLLQHLSRQGIKQVTVCSNGDASSLAESIRADSRSELNFLDEQLPSGTAGCIRDVASGETDGLLLVFPASLICPPPIDVLISAHRNGQSDLTVMFNPGKKNGNLTGEVAGIYICETSVLEHIPKDGYFDIKEGLIPEMLRAGKTVHAATLPNHAGNFRNRQEYLFAIGNYLRNIHNLNGTIKVRSKTKSQTIWAAPDVRVDPSARIYGPVAIMDGARIYKNAVIFGPTIIGRNVHIGEHSFVANSALWDGAQVGANCEIQQCIVDFDATVKNNTIVQEKSVAFKPETVLSRALKKALKPVQDSTHRLQWALQAPLDKINQKLPLSYWVQSDKQKLAAWLAGSLILIAFLWSYWPNLAALWHLWQISDEYSAGLLVPFLAVYILWSRRHNISDCPMRPSIGWGLFALIIAQGIRLFGLFFMYGSAERFSIGLSIAALVLLLFGWQLFRRVFTVLVFMFLMLPWPNRFQAAIALPLQHWATSSAVFCLEVIGYQVVQEGNIIHIGGATVAVAEACNGLRMIIAFFVVSGLVVLLVKRAWWEKLIVLTSSLPIALLCNTVRLAITAVAFTVLTGEQWEKIFHDFGGYAMMPLALAALLGELWLLAKLTTRPMREKAIIITRQER